MLSQAQKDYIIDSLVSERKEYVKTYLALNAEFKALRKEIEVLRKKEALLPWHYKKEREAKEEKLRQIREEAMKAKKRVSEIRDKGIEIIGIQAIEHYHLDALGPSS